MIWDSSENFRQPDVLFGEYEAAYKRLMAIPVSRQELFEKNAAAFSMKKNFGALLQEAGINPASYIEAVSYGDWSEGVEMLVFNLDEADMQTHCFHNKDLFRELLYCLYWCWMLCWYL